MILPFNYILVKQIFYSGVAGWLKDIKTELNMLESESRAIGNVRNEYYCWKY